MGVFFYGEVMENDTLRMILEFANTQGYTDIITNMRNEIEMKQHAEILANHKFAITEIVEHKKGGDIVRWRTHLPDENGKQGKQIKRSTRKSLEDALITFYKDRDRQDKLTFKTVYMQWREYHFKLNGSSNNTKDKYITDYFRFINGNPIESMLINDITDIDIENYFISIIDSYHGTKNTKLDYKGFGKLYGYFDGTFKYAYKHRLIPSNPMVYLDRAGFKNACSPKKEKTADTELVPDEEFDMLLKQLYIDMKESPTNFTYCAVEFAAMTAMRVGEIATLKWEDIDFQRGFITVCRSDKYNKVRDENGNVIKRYWTVEGTKTKRSRRFPIDDYIRKSLERIRKTQFETGMVSEWVFPHKNYGWTHSLMIASCCKNKCKQLGFSRTYSIHALRKTLNSDMRSNNASSKMCSSMIGNTPEVNDEYYYYDNTDMDEKRRIVEKAHRKRCFA